MTSLFLILIVVVILTCIWLNNISARIGVPTLLAFIVLGIVFGNVGAIPVYLDNHSFAKDVCSVALLFIMFYGGFGTRWETVKPVVRESVLLASLGVVVTAGEDIKNKDKEKEKTDEAPDLVEDFDAVAKGDVKDKKKKKKAKKEDKDKKAEDKKDEPAKEPPKEGSSEPPKEGASS